MKNLSINSAANQDTRFIGVDHKCLLPGKSNHRCDHWGCKITAKQPHYYPGWKKFFDDHGTNRFHIHKRDLSKFTKEQLANMPANVEQNKAWLTPIPKGDGDKPNLNTGWIVEAEGYRPERSIYNADEVAFIHVEYKTLRSKSAIEIKNIIATQDVNKDNFHRLLNQSVMDVKEVAIYVGKKGGIPC